MYEREDDGNCPDCNYPGVVNKGKEKGSGPYFGIYARGSSCGYCGFKENLPPKTKIRPAPIEKQAMYQKSLDREKKKLELEKLSLQIENEKLKAELAALKKAGSKK